MLTMTGAATQPIRLGKTAQGLRARWIGTGDDGQHPPAIASPEGASGS